MSRMPRVVSRSCAITLTFFLALSSLGFVTVSCDYHMGTGAVVERYATVSIPYIEGDVDGTLQSILAKEIASTTQLRYLSYGGNLLLKVKLLEKKADPVGFRYAINTDGSMVDTLVATEDRLSVLVEVSLVESATCCQVVGPQLFSTSVDYDFQPDSSNSDLVQFSLGQVDFRGAAKDAALRPLYDKLAKQIADYITSAW